MNKYEINISHRTLGSDFQEIEALSAPRAVQQAIDFMFPRNATSPIPDLDQALAFGDVTIELKLVKVAARFRGDAGHDPAFSLVSDGSGRPDRPLPNKTGRSEVITDLETGTTFIIRDVPACTACGLVGHLAENCPKS